MTEVVRIELEQIPQIDRKDIPITEIYIPCHDAPVWLERIRDTPS